jgi:hypothetical protein
MKFRLHVAAGSTHNLVGSVVEGLGGPTSPGSWYRGPQRRQYEGTAPPELYDGTAPPELGILRPATAVHAVHVNLERIPSLRMVIGGDSLPLRLVVKSKPPSVLW